jgi:hypothetical protein
MQRIGGIQLSFLSNLQRHTHAQGLRAMRGNQDVPGLGPKPILVVLQRHAGRGEISGHRRESKQVAHAYLNSDCHLSSPGTAFISGFGRTSYENVIEPCRALSYRCPVDRVAERHGSLANRNRPHQPASQHHGRGAEAGGKARGKTTEAGAAGGKHGCSSPDIASPSNAIDISSKAGVRLSDGEDCRD